MRASELKASRPTVLKIGGSVITDKQTELIARTQVIDRLVEEIQAADIQKLIVVHGGGSFGHPMAKRYSIKEGFKEASQLVGFAETHHVMTMLNGLVVDSLIWHDVPAVGITPSSCIMTENGRIKSFEDTSVRRLLEMGFLPVLYGDAVLDTKLGFTILSGDQLTTALALRFNAERIIMGVDVDGLFECDPKSSRSAEFFSHLTLEDAKKVRAKLDDSTARDVTGGMFGKIGELIPAVEKGISVAIVNACESRLVYNALKGEKVKGTVIEKE
jgi:isopentenyl phosphate kinase